MSICVLEFKNSRIQAKGFPYGESRMIELKYFRKVEKEMKKNRW